MAVNLFISFLPEHQPEEFITISRSSGGKPKRIK